MEPAEPLSLTRITRVEFSGRITGIGFTRLVMHQVADCRNDVAVQFEGDGTGAARVLLIYPECDFVVQPAVDRKYFQTDELYTQVIVGTTNIVTSVVRLRMLGAAKTVRDYTNEYIKVYEALRRG